MAEDFTLCGVFSRLYMVFFSLVLPFVFVSLDECLKLSMCVFVKCVRVEDIVV